MTILIAEDDPISLRALRLNLEALGHVVLTASDGESAWRLVVDHPEVNLVLSDWMMPGVDGLELCRRVRDLSLSGRPYIYFILLTAKAHRDDRLAGLSAGADDFLTKPLDPAVLIARLTVALRLLATQNELYARTSQLERAQEELRRQNEQLAEIATSDGLTGLKNQRYFRAALDMAVSFASRQNLPLTLIMLDADEFKPYNDAFGHPAGDEALRVLAGALRENVRDHDLVARYGGEEFALLLPATDEAAGRSIGERIRLAVAGVAWPLRPVTASLGVAHTSPLVSTSEVLLSLADQALYHSKATGRNRVTHAVDLMPRGARGFIPFRLVTPGSEP